MPGWNGGHLDGRTFWVRHFLLPSWDLLQGRPSVPHSSDSPTSTALTLTLMPANSFCIPGPWCPLPGPIQDLSCYIRGRALGWWWWKEICRLRQGLPKRQSGRLQIEALRHTGRHSETGRGGAGSYQLSRRSSEATLRFFQTPLDRLLWRKQCPGVPSGLPFQPTSRSPCGPPVALRDQSEEGMCFLFRRTNQKLAHLWLTYRQPTGRAKIWFHSPLWSWSTHQC